MEHCKSQTQIEKARDAADLEREFKEWKENHNSDCPDHDSEHCAFMCGHGLGYDAATAKAREEMKAMNDRWERMHRLCETKPEDDWDEAPFLAVQIFKHEYKRAGLAHQQPSAKSIISELTHDEIWDILHKCEQPSAPTAGGSDSGESDELPLPAKFLREDGKGFVNI